MRSEAYNLLDKTNEFLEAVEQRGQLLSQSIQFFRVATAALTKLDQLEVQLAAHQAAPGSTQLAQLHSKVSLSLEDATAPALHRGYSLLDQAGRSHPGTEVRLKNKLLFHCFRSIFKIFSYFDNRVLNARWSRLRIEESFWAVSVRLIRKRVSASRRPSVHSLNNMKT